MVYNEPKVRQNFNCYTWIYISQQCQKRPVWGEILISLISQSQSESQNKKDEIRNLTGPDIIS